LPGGTAIAYADDKSRRYNRVFFEARWPQATIAHRVRRRPAAVAHIDDMTEGVVYFPLVDADDVNRRCIPPRRNPRKGYVPTWTRVFFSVKIPRILPHDSL
jgi:hypothetical protein